MGTILPAKITSSYIGSPVCYFRLLIKKKKYKLQDQKYAVPRHKE